MLVTMFCDSSHDDKLVVTGWGSWSRSERMTIGEVRGGWTADPRVRGSTQAELYGTLAAIQCGLEDALILPGDTVLVQCDCKAVGDMLDFTSFPSDDCGVLLKAWMRQIRSEARLSFRYKHIEGHKSPLLSTRHSLNNMVDARARQGLKTARKYVSNGAPPHAQSSRIS